MADIVEHWGVYVRINGQRVLTIESNSLSGIENIQDYADAVRSCARHLLSFIGEPDTSTTLSSRDAEIERLRSVVEAAKRWRRAYHHGNSEEVDLQEECLLMAIDDADNEQLPKSDI